MIDALMIFASIVIVYIMLSIAPGIQAQEPELIPVNSVIFIDYMWYTYL